VKIDLDQVKLLLQMVGETDISELTIEMAEERITIKKGSMSTHALGHGTHPIHATELPTPNTSKESHVFSIPPTSVADSLPTGNAADNGDLTAITAPMVGTFYRASSPTATPFVDVGDKVSIGQTVCIIEAMKLMNDLPSEIAGKVVKICAENGATVEYGQQLFLVDTKG
jgi:acetyl-CoA carboxylase biotin carboxyl carrier protein